MGSKNTPMWTHKNPNEARAELGIITNYNELTNYKKISFLEPENNL